ncbi:MAG: Nramp family divalent metal transporter, partial [Planctomycetaceae bacterium]|nr:Nramp family divalent metal transporter [Planctomycetaceae bacterium]
MTDSEPEFDTVAPEFDQEPNAGVESPPTTIGGTLLKLGPGLIIAGSIVGSGELIATTKTGAQAGIALLWLIIVGCLIKVFVQIELGRYAISHGQTTLNALNQIPGKMGPVNFIVWFWLAMMMTGLAQLGGIVGGVGQAMAVAWPITGDYLNAVQIPAADDIEWYLKWHDDLVGTHEEFQKLGPLEQDRVRNGHDRLEEQLNQLGERGEAALQTIRDGGSLPDPWTWDDRIWAAVVTLITVAVLYNGR